MPPRSTDALLLHAPETAGLWARRSAHGDAFRVLTGWGSARCEIPLGVDLGTLRPELRPVVEAATLLRDVPVEIDLGSDAGDAIAIVGEDAAAVARSLLVQLAVQCGPADWRLVVVTDDVTRHGWAEWLPHAATGHETKAVVDHDDSRALTEMLDRLVEGTPRVVVLTDVPAVLATRTSPLRRFLASDRPVTTIVTIDRGDAVPAFCRSVLEVGTRARPAGTIQRTRRSDRTGSTSPGWRPRRPCGSRSASPGSPTRRIPPVRGPS